MRSTNSCLQAAGGGGCLSVAGKGGCEAADKDDLALGAPVAREENMADTLMEPAASAFSSFSSTLMIAMGRARQAR
jgi:hypothetical protein